MKVYFNNSCNICRTEINIYKKQNIEEIEWIDITNNNNALKETSKTKKLLLRRLHVEKNGEIYSGAKAFLLLWEKIPRYKFLYNLFKLPIIFQIFSFSYEIIAYFLYLKNKDQIK